MQPATNPDSLERSAHKAKILYLITKSNWGGAQKYVFELATGLNPAEFDVAVGLGGDGELKTRLEAAGIRTITIPSLDRDVNVFSDTRVFFSLLSLFRKERADIIHVNSSKIGGLGALAARIARVPKIVFTGHGWAFNENRSELAKSLIRFLHWITIILSDETIVVSEHMKRQVGSLPFVTGKISVIHNGIAATDFLPKTEAREFLWKKSGHATTMPEDMLWIGTISELHPSKGLEYAIESLVRIRDEGGEFLFFILGGGQEHEKLQALIREKDLEQKVFLCGHIEKAARYLKALDVFTLTSTTEALGYVIIEAGQAGLPVLASSAGGIPEIIAGDQFGILAQPRNVKDISLGIKTLLGDSSLREKLGENLKTRVAKEFSFESMREQTLRIYRTKMHRS